MKKREKSFKVGDVPFTAIFKKHPWRHWVFRTDENQIVYGPGNGGFAFDNFQNMKAAIQETLDGVSKGNIADFRKRMSLPKN